MDIQVAGSLVSDEDRVGVVRRRKSNSGTGGPVSDNVIIHPFGRIDQHLVESVRYAVEQRFRVKASVGSRLEVPATAFSRQRGQYHSTAILQFLSAIPGGEGETRLGILNVDLYVPSLNFVFGEASTRVAVFSLARLRWAPTGRKPDEAALLRRAITEAVHELGHVWGLRHCTRRDCVMWFSNTLGETDRKGSEFCKRCAQELLASRSC